MDNEKYIEIEEMIENKINCARDNFNFKSLYDSIDNLNYFIESYLTNIRKEIEKLKENYEIVKRFVKDNSGQKDISIIEKILIQQIENKTNELISCLERFDIGEIKDPLNDGLSVYNIKRNTEMLTSNIQSFTKYIENNYKI